MFTPQEIQEKTFVKAVFGGYDMQTVDEFLEPLTEDYITLYKENAVLKSKMKVLVEKLEEYRSQEQSMRKAILSAQRTADAMVAEAEKKAAQLMNNAHSAAQTKSVDADAIVSQEEERINCAKQAAQNFIEVLEQDIRGHLELLENLKKRDLTVESKPEPKRQKPFNFEEEDQEVPLIVPKARKEAPAVQAEPVVKAEVKAEPVKVETTEDIANEIEQNITRLMDLDVPAAPPEPAKPTHADSSTIKFTNLQFGRNYDPTSGK